MPKFFTLRALSVLSHADRVEPSHGSDQWRLRYNILLQEDTGRNSMAPFDLYVPRV